jgi:hypothetical protein
MKTASALLLATVTLLPLTTGAGAQTVCPTAVGCYRGAPGPIIGAGLPLLAAGGIGYGIYWLRKRRRRAD